MHRLTLAPRHRQLFDRAAADASGIAKIDRLNVFDAFAPDLARLDLQAECDQAEQEQFRFGVAAVDIGGRIGLGVAFLLRFLERFGVGFPALLHLRQDVITSAVDDAENRFRFFDGETLAQRTDDRNAAANAGLEAQLLAATFFAAAQISLP